jgi:hypothetical protein
MNRSYLALLSIAFVGCGSPSTDSVDQFLASYATLECAWQFHCCTDAEIKTATSGKYATQADCVSYYELGEEDPQFVDRLAVRQGRLKLDSAKTQACLAALMAEPCNSKTSINPNPNSFPMDVPACADVFDGATPVGSPCQFVGECVSGSHCVADALTGSGVCVPYQELGQICNDTTDCDPAAQPVLYCAKQDFKCHTPSPLGGPCAYKLDAAGQPTQTVLLECDPTVANLYCDPMSTTCKQLPTAGQPCLTNPPPGVPACDPDPTLQLVCQTTAGSTTGTCTGPAKLNQPCSGLIQCDTKANLYCDPVSNVCLALPTLNQNCSNAPKCATPYYCDTTKAPATCAQLAQANQPCVTNFGGSNCDVNLYCDDFTNPAMPLCKPLLADGSMCMQSVQCTSQMCIGIGATKRICAASPTPIIMCSGRP